MLQQAREQLFRLWNLPAAIRFLRTYGPDIATWNARPPETDSLAAEASRNFLDEMIYLLPRRCCLAIDALECEGLLSPEGAASYREHAHAAVVKSRVVTYEDREDGTMAVASDEVHSLPWDNDPSLLTRASPELRTKLAELQTDVETLRKNMNGFIATT